MKEEASELRYLKYDVYRAKIIEIIGNENYTTVNIPLCSESWNYVNASHTQKIINSEIKIEKTPT